MVNFFKRKEEEQIIQTIQDAELKTTGQIRVHLAHDYEGDIMDAACKVFYLLEMQKTQGRTGVLFYLVPKKHQFAIIGDEGIDDVVPENYWDETRDLAQLYFKQGEFAKGVCEVVEHIGEKLSEFFPRTEEKGINELPDNLSFEEREDS